MHITALVIKGLGQAKKLGFPTLNISPRRAPKSFKPGVYAARVFSKAGNFRGVAYFGPRFAKPDSTVFEVHCFGLKKNLLRTKITVELGKRLRGVKKFKSAEEAGETIGKDIARAKMYIKR